MGKTRVFALALAVAVAQLVSVSVGHVALTFPAARRFDLDFLDNLRTKAPCGMPKGKAGLVLRDKMNCGVGLVNCFIRVPLMYQPCCLLPCCQGKLGKLTKKQFTKPTPQFILGHSTFV